jgi:hypothetical protein
MGENCFEVTEFKSTDDLKKLFCRREMMFQIQAFFASLRISKMCGVHPHMIVVYNLYKFAVQDWIGKRITRKKFSPLRCICWSIRDHEGVFRSVGPKSSRLTGRHPSNVNRILQFSEKNGIQPKQFTTTWLRFINVRKYDVLPRVLLWIQR